MGQDNNPRKYRREIEVPSATRIQKGKILQIQLGIVKILARLTGT